VEDNRRYTFSAMADANDWDDEFLILQSGDDPIAAHAISPEFP